MESVRIWTLCFLLIPAIDSYTIFQGYPTQRRAYLDQSGNNRYAMDVALITGTGTTSVSGNNILNGPPPPPSGTSDGPGGPYDFDPADNPQLNADSTQKDVATNPGTAPVAVQVQGPPPSSFDVNWSNGLPGSFPLSNQATGTLINTGSAQHGKLQASGRSNTNTGPSGASSIGTGNIRGQGQGLSATEINSGQAGTNALGPASDGPGSSPSGSSTNNFINSLSAQQGKINGQSDTVSRTGPDGSAFGSSGGSATGLGDGVQLTQVANSNSDSSGPSVPWSSRWTRAVPSSWPFFGLSQDAPLSSAPLIVFGGAGPMGTPAGGYNMITRYDPKSGTITQVGGGGAMYLSPGSLSSLSAAGGSGSSSVPTPVNSNATVLVPAVTSRH